MFPFNLANRQRASGEVDVVLYNTNMGTPPTGVFDLPAGWSFGLNDGPSWTVEDGSAYGYPSASNGYVGASGYSQLNFVNNGNNPGQTVNLPDQNCTGYNNIRIQFGFCVGLSTVTDTVSFAVEYSVNGGGAWSSIPITFDPELVDVWDLREYSLSLASNQSSVKVRLIGNDFTGTQDQFYAFDDFTILGDEI